MSRFRTPIHRELNRGLCDIIGAGSASELARLGLFTLGDLLRHVPHRYLSDTEVSDFRTLRPGEDVAIVARVVATRIVDGRTTRVATVLTDGHGELQTAFFVPDKHPNYAKYWTGQLTPGARSIFVDKVGEFRGQLQLTHPDYVIIDEFGTITGRKTTAKATMVKVIQRARLVGLYPATAKMVTWKIADAITLTLPHVLPLGDTLPDWVVERAGMIGLPNALREVHEPVNVFDAKRGIARLKFDEAFGIQLTMAAHRAALAGRTTTPRPRRDDGILSTFDASLPYRLTAGQEEVGETLFEELTSERPMHRLLQGEVGSGKTLVALRAMLAVVDAGGQAALLAPTEVLAKQHHASITSLLGGLRVAGTLEAHPHATQVALLTGGLTAANRRRTRETVASEEAGIVIGTHALLSEDVGFTDLDFVVVDEQHRFGVEQRATLAAKSEHQPHTLVMTATPIPRSVAMTIFGNLETIELRDRPAGHAEVKTVFVDTARNPHWVDRTWERIREEVAQGRQAFVVCPAISGNKTEGDLETGTGLGAVTEITPMLTEGPLKGLRVGMVHGRQATAERGRTIRTFTAGELDVLVSTTVIKVGVDIPNASVMVILDASRFGIAQLHQLRGRIGRNRHPGLYLLLAAPTPDTLTAVDKLQALVSSTDGFELAERDLELRREGDVLEAAQSGASSLKLLRVLGDRKVIEQAKELAGEVLSDSRAAEDPLLADMIDQAEQVAAGEWLERG